MATAHRRSIPVGTIVSILIGIAGVGAPMQFPGDNYKWLWALMFYGGAVGAIFFIAWGVVEHARGGATTLVPDLPMKRFAEQQLGTSNFFATGNIDRLTRLLKEAQQKARLGQITVWGRKDCEPGHTHVPLSPIPADFWDTNEIHVVEFLRGGVLDRGQAGTAKIVDAKMLYGDLNFNKREVRAAWPNRLLKIRWRLPVVLEKRR